MGILKRKFGGVVLGLSILAMLFAGASSTQAQSREYELKAAFLINFTKYVKWPASAMPAGALFTIGLLGGDPFGGELDKAVQGESVGGRKIAVRHGGDMRGCQMVFVTRNGGGAAGVQGPGVLTIGESPGFARQGGVIEFILKDNTVRFEINADAAEKSGLQIKSTLLQMGRAGR